MANNSDRKKDQPRGHVFDGIFEYDNDLPIWWVALFIITIVFSGVYMAWYHLGIFPSQSLEDEYSDAVRQARAAESAASLAEAATSEPAGSVDDVTAGRDTYVSTCAPCHGLQGGGIIGPNLTDDFWLNGATTAAVEAIIIKGAPEKGMPAWGDALGRGKIRQLVTYIVSIQGSKPADPKAAQGEPGQLK